MSEACQELHRILAALPRHGSDFRDDELPDDGLYCMFQHGETGHGTDRIVRIGTHRRQGQLAGRLKEHFRTENKDRSIFRKHVGRALLAKADDPFLEQWDWDRTARQERERRDRVFDEDRQREVERQVTAFIADNFTFAVLHVPTKVERMAIETAILSTVASCGACGPSRDWLGLHHPNDTISRVGLWNIQGLTGEPLTTGEVRALLESTALAQ